MIVTWTEEASDRLADIFVAADLEEQNELERAVLAINARLALGAIDLGESRGSVRRRVWFAERLVVRFEALSDPAVVVVTHVARLCNRPESDE